MKLLLILLIPLLLSAQEVSIIRIESASRKTITTLYEEGFDITASIAGKYCDIAVSKEDSLSLASRFKITTLVSGKELSRNQRVQAEKTYSRSRNYSDPQYIDYKTYTEEIHNLQKQYPDIMKVIELGKSQGAIQQTPGFDHRIWGIKISDNVSVNESEPGFLFVGTHHARETQTFPVTYAFLKELLEKYASDPIIRSYVDNNQIFFVPLMNPDGYTVAITENNMWRKNINSNSYSVSFKYGSFTGVDLNRNYRYKWGENAPDNPTKETHRGAEPHSEAEIKAIINLIETESISAAITFHSYGELILFPFNQKSNSHEKPADYTEIKKLADKMAEVMPKKSGFGTYDVGNAVDLLGYGSGGGMADHIYVNHGIFAYCFELWSGGFHTSENQLPALARNVSKACKHMIERASYSSFEGIITADGVPIRAKVFISGLDDNSGDRADYFSHKESGFYCRFTPPGTYSVTVSPENKQFPPRSFNISVKPDTVTSLDVNFGEYSQHISLTVINGSGSGYYKPGDIVTVAADTPDKNQIFTGWKDLPDAIFPGSLSTPVTITVPDSNCTIYAELSNLTSDKNRISENWSVESDSGSTVIIDSASLSNDSLLTIHFKRKTATADLNTWTAAGISPAGKYDKLTHIRLIYRSEGSYRISLDQAAPNNSSSSFSVILPGVSEFTEVILPLSQNIWKSNNLTDNEKLHSDFRLTTQNVNGIIFNNIPEESSIAIKELNLIGFKDKIVIEEAPIKSGTLRFLSKPHYRLSFVASEIGNYRIQLFTVSGKIIQDITLNSSEPGSELYIPFKYETGHQILFLKINSTKNNFLMKIAI